jgi:hypothetical protein
MKRFNKNELLYIKKCVEDLLESNNKQAVEYRNSLKPDEIENIRLYLLGELDKNEGIQAIIDGLGLYVWNVNDVTYDDVVRYVDKIYAKIYKIEID